MSQERLRTATVYLSSGQVLTFRFLASDSADLVKTLMFEEGVQQVRAKSGDIWIRSKEVLAVAAFPS